MKGHYFDLTGKVAVITGASSGIGVEIARAYASQGADIVLLARRYKKLTTLAQEIEKMGRNVLALKCDITKEEEIGPVVKTVLEKFGRIDILLNNAGVTSIGAVEDIKESEWNRIIDTNVKGVYLMSKHVLVHMKERNYGKIINIASVCGQMASKSLPQHAYSASKGAVINLTRTMGATYAQHGITVNAIGPGLFRSEMTEILFHQDNDINQYNTICPAGRVGNCGELNGAAIYFASDASSYTTGQTLFVDGGWTLV